MLKRGQGIQFNWIFVLIAGVILLAFFMGFGARFIELEEKKEAARIEVTMDSLIDSVRSQQQYTNFSIGKNFEINYDCESLRVDKGNGIPTRDILFLNNGNYREAIFLSKSFENPYQIINLVYFINKDKKYFIEDSNLKGLVPEGVSLVSFEDEADVIYAQGKDIWSNNEFVFYKNEEPIPISGINNDIVKLGAIFADYEIFGCGIEKIRERQEIIDEVYLGKINFLSKTCYSGLRNSILSRDRLTNSIESENIKASNQGCEVIF